MIHFPGSEDAEDLTDVEDALAEPGDSVGGWCVWCGTGTYDGDRITDEGVAAGFTPSFVVRIPDGFHREAVDR